MNEELEVKAASAKKPPNCPPPNMPNVVPGKVTELFAISTSLYRILDCLSLNP